MVRFGGGGQKVLRDGGVAVLNSKRVTNPFQSTLVLKVNEEKHDLVHLLFPVFFYFFLFFLEDTKISFQKHNISLYLRILL